jgi:hypothetical protein
LNSSLSGTSTALNYQATLSFTSGAAPIFSETGGSLGGTTTSSADSYDYSWNPYTATYTLNLAAGETVTLDYALSSYANGSMSSLGTCSPPGGGGSDGTDGALGSAGGQGQYSCFNAAVGRIGDPFNPDIVPQGVPEPISGVLLTSGFAGLLYARRRRLP